MRRALPVLLILWALGGLAWTLRDTDERGAATDPGAAPPAEVPAGAPLLRTQGGAARPRKPIRTRTAVSAVSVPGEVREAALRGADGDGAPVALSEWLAGEPRRLVALLRAVGGRLAGGQGSDDERLVFQAATRLLRRLGPHLGDRAPWRHAVEQAVEEGGEGRSAMLGALLILDLVGAQAREAVRATARDGSASAALRLQAARVLLANPPPTPADAAAIAVVLALPAENATDSLDLQDLLGRVARLGADPAARAALRPLTSALLACHERYRDKGWIEGAALGALVAVAPEHPEVRERLSTALHAPRTPSVQDARRLLRELAPEDVLSYLQEASASVQVEGVEMLLGRGVAKGSLAPLVLAALARGGPVTRARAVGLLAKVGTDVSAALPVIDAHLASQDRARWLSGVQALGALSTVPGDRRLAVDRLLTVARWPDVKVRVTAVQSILMHDARPDAVLELLTALVDDTEPAVRREAVDGLGEMMATQPEARRALEGARTDADEAVRELVVYWLDGQSEDD